MAVMRAIPPPHLDPCERRRRAVAAADGGAAGAAAWADDVEREASRLGRLGTRRVTARREQPLVDVRGVHIEGRDDCDRPLGSAERRGLRLLLIVLLLHRVEGLRKLPRGAGPDHGRESGGGKHRR